MWRREIWCVYIYITYILWYIYIIYIGTYIHTNTAEKPVYIIRGGDEGGNMFLWKCRNTYQNTRRHKQGNDYVHFCANQIPPLYGTLRHCLSTWSAPGITLQLTYAVPPPRSFPQVIEPLDRKRRALQPSRHAADIRTASRIEERVP